MNSFQPCIKWSGSKRSQAKKILEYFPRQIETYYEPFCGGASVFRALVDSDIKVKRFALSDSNPHLINLWQRIKTFPKMVSDRYRELWNEMHDYKKTVKEKQAFYNSIREGYNKTFNPCDFMFLMRTCYNGMARFNKDGKFNSPYHLNRDGINPDALTNIILDWHIVLNQFDVEIECCDYKDIETEKGDFVYLDPPYNGTKGLYMGSFDSGEMFDWIRDLDCGWALSYNGKSGAEDNTFAVPEDLYDAHVYLESGNSSFRRIVESSRNTYIKESLYFKKLNYDQE